MGLDSFLSAKKSLYYGGSVESKIAEAVQKLLPELDSFSSSFGEGSVVTEIKIEAGYWRKANQIHRWFVDNVQSGVDDCGAYRVGRDKLRDLHELCTGVLLNGQDPATTLPTTEGFFFGSTVYGEGYYSDLKHTLMVLNQCLALPDDWCFEYQSSW